MTDLSIAAPTSARAASAVRRYGTWGEGQYEYGAAPAGQAVATKRFTWTQAVVTVHGAFPLELSYFSTAVAEPRKMNDLAYLAGVERQALEVLETMILAALSGTAYVAVPHPVVEVQKDVFQTLGEWVRQGGYPEDWAGQVQTVIATAFERLKVWKQRLEAMQARLDTDHPSWGLAVPIQPIEPRDPSP